jgi:hypothetical protein
VIHLTGAIREDIELRGTTQVFVKATPDAGDKRGQPIGMLLTLTYPVSVADLTPVEIAGVVGTFETENE